MFQENFKGETSSGVHAKRYFYKGHTGVLQKQLDTLAEKLKEAEDKMVEQGIDHFASGDPVVRFFNDGA